MTPASSSDLIVSRREKTWYPPESVRIGPAHPEKTWIPPRSSMTSSPGRKWRWYAFPRTTWAPSARTSSGWSDFTVAFVPTGMKAGVRIAPCASFENPSAGLTVGGFDSEAQKAAYDIVQEIAVPGATPRLLPL